MKAMILAAGEGRRMRPLTLTTPKPLLAVNGKSLIEYQIDHLKKAGIKDIIINISYLAEAIKRFLGDGSMLGVNIQYSEESTALETGGAIVNALPLLGDAPFILVNGDVWTDYQFSHLKKVDLKAVHRGRVATKRLAHLVLVDNPQHNPEGDFCLDGEFLMPLVSEGGGLTFSGISIINPALIVEYPQKRPIFPLVEALRWAMGNSAITAEYYAGTWTDVGTPERLQSLQG